MKMKAKNNLVKLLSIFVCLLISLSSLTFAGNGPMEGDQVGGDVGAESEISDPEDVIGGVDFCVFNPLRPYEEQVRLARSEMSAASTSQPSNPHGIGSKAVPVGILGGFVPKG